MRPAGGVAFPDTSPWRAKTRAAPLRGVNNVRWMTLVDLQLNRLCLIVGAGWFARRSSGTNNKELDRDVRRLLETGLGQWASCERRQRQAGARVGRARGPR